MHHTSITGRLASLLCAMLIGCGGGSGDPLPAGNSDTPTTGTTGGTPGGSTPIAAQCVPTASFSFGGGGSVVKVAAEQTVVEMQQVADAVSAGPSTVQSLAVTPGDYTFQLYTLAQGQCTSATTAQNPAAQSYAQAQGSVDAGTRVFVVLTATSDILVQICGYAGVESAPCSTVTAFVSGVVQDATSNSPISGATVSVVNNGTTYTSTTDSAGLFDLQTPMATLPQHFVANVFDGVHAPAALTFNQQDDNVYAAGAVSLGAVTADRIPLELSPTVHHLGDSNFGGTVNSQFQFPQAEGLSIDYPFTVTAPSLAFAQATFSVTAKGIECPDALTINGVLVSSFAGSPSDGSYGQEVLPVPIGLLHVGANVATVTSAVCSGSDYDDFELTSPVMTFN